MLSIQPQKSRAILFGASEFLRDSEHLLPLPQVQANLNELARLLTDPDTIGIPWKQITVMLNPATTDEVLEALNTACNEAEDTLFMYYSGHGLVGRTTAGLYLSTARTIEAQAEVTGLEFERVRWAIANSPAAKKILIIDCCFSGRALPHLGSETSLLQANLDLQGTFAIASAPANQMAQAPPREQYTAFTAELIRTLTNGINNNQAVITLEELYQSVRTAIRNKPNLPEPLRANSEDADRLIIAYNHWSRISASLRNFMAETSQQIEALKRAIPEIQAQALSSAETSQQIEALKREIAEIRMQKGTLTSTIGMVSREVEEPNLRYLVWASLTWSLNAFAVPALAEIVASLSMREPHVAVAPSPSMAYKLTYAILLFLELLIFVPAFMSTFVPSHPSRRLLPQFITPRALLWSSLIGLTLLGISWSVVQTSGAPLSAMIVQLMVSSPK
jgi:uncharacterized caspase-like protein